MKIVHHLESRTALFWYQYQGMLWKLHRRWESQKRSNPEWKQTWAMARKQAMISNILEKRLTRKSTSSSISWRRWKKWFILRWKLSTNKKLLDLVKPDLKNERGLSPHLHWLMTTRGWEMIWVIEKRKLDDGSKIWSGTTRRKTRGNYKQITQKIARAQAQVVEGKAQRTITRKRIEKHHKITKTIDNTIQRHCWWLGKISKHACKPSWCQVNF